MNRKRHNYVHEWFYETVAKHPGRAAIDTGHQRISYEELSRRSQAVASAIARGRSAVGRPVIVFTEDRVNMVAALIGTLTAGAAFVPLTPDLPDARLAEMVASAEPSCVLVDADLADRYTANIEPGATRDRILSFDSLDLRAEFTPPDLDPDHFCYIYFTSGSTGVPKGIAGRLKAIDHFIRWELQTLDLQPGARVSQLISPTFDAFLRDVFVPLCSGGTICMPPADGILEGQALADWIDAREINLIHCVPSLFRTLFPFLGAERFPRLRQLLLSGEALRPSDVAVWHSAFDNRIALINLYGPSETTMTKFAYTVSAEDQHRRSVPIGKPIPGAMAFISDENGRPTSSVGEICIRTPFCSAGYYRQPELTAEVFSQNQFGTDKNDLIYKTGDIGRILEDGNFELLGRNDRQVKLRGTRIDPVEIESATVATRLVREAVVAVHEDGNEQMLCAYVVLNRNTAVSEVRNALNSRLPAAMIPSLFIPIERIPTLPNGKLDRSALPDPRKHLASSRATAAEPYSPIEEIIAGIWCGLLGLPSVRREDSFFELGGHSLLAAQATARTANALDIEMPLRLMLQAPRLGDLADKVQQLMKEQEGIGVPELARAEGNGRLPLSFAQQRLWLIDQLEPGSTAYNVPFAVRLTGELDRVALGRALSEIVRRHEVLRTTFLTEDDGPAQVIGEPQPVTVRLVDVEHVEKAARLQVARRLIEAEAKQPFSLSTGPLLRAMLVRLSEEEHVLVIVLHHIVSDGWSVGVLTREFSVLYEAYGQDLPSPLEELQVQYADYAVWQRQWLTEEMLAEQLRYWRKQLEGIQRLELPTDRPRLAVRTGRGSALRFQIDSDLAEQLKALSRVEGVTLFMMLVAGFQLLLRRYAGQEDVAIGTAIANRNRVEVEPLVGFFVNTLVLRSDLSGNPTFRELLKRVSGAAIGAYIHHEAPFEKLVEELYPDRDSVRTSLFQVAFGFENVPRSPLQLAGLDAEVIGVEATASKFDLTLTLSEAPGMIEGRFEYSTDLFSQETIARMITHLRNIYRSVTADANRPLSTIPMLDPSERHQLLTEWNSTSTDYPKDRCVHQLLEQQAAFTPGAVALIYEDEQVSYEELNRRANQLGRYLRKLGVGPESRVGVCLERGVEMVVTWAGVLKAGGAYVPLDPAYPKERIAYMLADAEVRVLVTQGRLTASLPDYQGETIIIDEQWDDIAGESAKDLPNRTSADNLAYVIYTSGSTGKPKGVSVAHRAIVRLVKETDYVKLGPGDKVAQASNSSFDAVTFEIWGALLNGSALVGVSKEVALSAQRLAQAIREQGITTMFLTTALFNQITREEPTAFSGMRQVLFGGEAVDANRVRELLSAGTGPERLLHVYGPTESTTFSTWMLVEDVEEAAATVPIGKPLANTQVYVLDGGMEPVAVGIYGDLYLAGDGLARCYAKRPDLTAEKFLPHPHSNEPGQRLYQTGDIVRYLPDGNLEFLGRRDNQVKVRGFRIEPGEIEAVLSEHPMVKECAVVVQHGGDGGKRIVAYFVPRGQQIPSVGELRRYAKERLPEYMVPATFMVLADLPLTANGKVDREALPEPDPSRSKLESEFVAPRTTVEEVVAGIWSELLGTDLTGIHDNFFELGGHSLLATQFASRARVAFGIELPLRAVFENPTLESIAAVIEALEPQETARAQDVLPITVNDDEVESLLAAVEELSDEEARIALGNQNNSIVQLQFQGTES
jgi:amino acid adenylation domain-containing protein